MNFINLFGIADTIILAAIKFYDYATLIALLMIHCRLFQLVYFKYITPVIIELALFSVMLCLYCYLPRSSVRSILLLSNYLVIIQE